MSVQVLLTRKEILALKKTLEEKQIEYMLEESYILDGFSKGSFERIKPLRTMIATKEFNDSVIKVSLNRYMSVEMSQAILFIKNKIDCNELKKPGDLVPVLIRDEGMYFWVIGLITRLGGFHLCIKLFGQNKWKEGRVLYIGY